jgi:hypothetical protein
MDPVTTAKPKVRPVQCPNCGAGVELRGFGQSVSAVCVQCLSVIDTKDPGLSILQTFQARERILPLIPLGARGRLEDGVFEVIGFQARVCTVDGVEYEWREYVLFNPYRGFRYLSEYNGHWNYIWTLPALPGVGKSLKGRPQVSYRGKSFDHFQTVTATTSYVMGEFPWRVHVGETVQASDYIRPPEMLSSEVSAGEVTWSLGKYTSGGALWKAFQLQGAPPAPDGVFSNQPSPHQGKAGRSWTAFLIALLALALLFMACSVLMRQEKVFEASYTFRPADRSGAAFVTDLFELKGRTSNMELLVDTDLDNSWVYFNFALINDSTGQAWEFGREVSYYHGRDSDGSWSEGGRRDRAVIPAVPAGRYYLRVEPETEAVAGQSLPQSVGYSIAVRRDVPMNSFFLIAAGLLLLPPVWVSIRSAGFEAARWRESDYAGGSSD